VNLFDFVNGLQHDISFDFNIPFDDLLPIQAFDLFPNYAIGDIELKYQVQHDALIWCPVDPHEVFNRKVFIEEESPTASLPSVLEFKRRFGQIDNPVQCFVSTAASETAGGPYIVTSGPITVTCQNRLTVTELRSFMCGHGINQTAKEDILQMIDEHALITPSQQMQQFTFPKAPSKGNADNVINIPLQNTTCMSVVFPKRNNDITVFDNPILNNLYLQIGSVNYPDQGIISVGRQMMQYQLTIYELDRLCKVLVNSKQAMLKLGMKTTKLLIRILWKMLLHLFSMCKQSDQEQDIVLTDSIAISRTFQHNFVEILFAMD
jgi:hypothetical protein